MRKDPSNYFTGGPEIHGQIIEIARVGVLSHWLSRLIDVVISSVIIHCASISVWVTTPRITGLKILTFRTGHLGDEKRELVISWGRN